jgi:GntR family transcriptional regulator/MocR family aminotransferase
MAKRAGGSLLLSIRIDRDHRHGVSTQLSVALRELILNGGLAPGERLPATRTLAQDLGVSRTTVVEAFSRLAAEGLINAQTGAGTFVSAVMGAERPLASKFNISSPESSSPRLSAVMERAIPLFAERSRLPYSPRAFTTALPAFDAFPMAQWAALSAKWLRGNRNDVMGYGHPYGSMELRRAVALHLRANRGITCEPEQVFILGGAQQAFNLIGSVLINPGDKVWFENPGAIGARNSLIASGADLIPIPVDNSGLQVEEGLRLAPHFRMAFVTPSHQQPLGCVLSLARRFALLQAAEQAGAWVIEDDYDGDFFFSDRPPPTLKSVDTTGRVIYVGTFSKSLFPALRLGYLLAPPALVDTFCTVMSRFVQGVPSHTQGMVAEFIDEGRFAVHVRRMRQLYFERHAALAAAANKHLAGLLDVVPAKGGLHTVGYLAPGLVEGDVCQEADRRGITVSPIGRFAITPLNVSGLVLGFGGSPPKVIEAGVEVLADVLEKQLRAEAQRLDWLRLSA